MSYAEIAETGFALACQRHDLDPASDKAIREYVTGTNAALRGDAESLIGYIVKNVASAFRGADVYTPISTDAVRSVIDTTVAALQETLQAAYDTRVKPNYVVMVSFDYKDHDIAKFSTTIPVAATDENSARAKVLQVLGVCRHPAAMGGDAWETKYGIGYQPIFSPSITVMGLEDWLASYNT